MSVHLLVPTDGSEVSAKGVQIAARIASVLEAKATLVNVVDLRRIEYKMIPDFQIEMIQDRARATAQRLLNRDAARMLESGVHPEKLLLEGPPAPVICEEASKNHDFIVFGAAIHGDLHDIFFGSVASALIHTCSRPMLVVKGEGSDWEHLHAGDKARVLIATDSSEACSRSIDFFVKLNAQKGTKLTLINVYNDEQGQAESSALLESRAKPLRDAGYEVDLLTREGFAGVTLCHAYTEGGFDLLVMGKRDMSELEERLVGSVCHFLFHNCNGHQLIIP